MLLLLHLYQVADLGEGARGLASPPPPSLWVLMGANFKALKGPKETWASALI